MLCAVEKQPCVTSEPPLLTIHSKAMHYRADLTLLIKGGLRNFPEYDIKSMCQESIEDIFLIQTAFDMFLLKNSLKVIACNNLPP